MITQDFYSGEPVTTGSPPIFDKQQENEAANMASFGRYDYDPGSRSTVTSIPTSIYPGGYGYNGIGIGAQPMGYSPYGNVQPTYNQYRGGNPVLQPGYNPLTYYQSPYYQQPQQYQIPTTYHIEGIGNSGKYMPPKDYQERIDALQMEYYAKRDEQDVKQEIERQNSVYNSYGYGGYNYYGVPYYNPFQYNSINAELSDQIKALENEAIDNRLNFQTNLSRLAHNFAGEVISNEDIMERYTGKDVEIPEAFRYQPQIYYDQTMYRRMVPFDNTQYYQQFHAEVSNKFHSIIPADSNLKDTFANMGIIQAQWDMEDEMHRRRDASSMYNSNDNSYKYFVRQKVRERYAREHGIPIQQVRDVTDLNINTMRQEFLNSTSTLSKSSYLSEDGTLNIVCPFGSHAGETYSVHNSQESEYDEKRERFATFVNSIQSNELLDKQRQQKIEEYSYG